METMKGEHIIYNKEGHPIFSNKPQSEQEREDKISYHGNIENEYVKMMEKEFKINGWNR